jgi:Uma2 family endonuclease
MGELMALQVPTHRFTVDEYEQMITVGILTEEDAVELIRGEIVDVSPIGPRHFDCVFMLTRLLTRSVPDDVGVSVQSPIRLPNNSGPQPDLALIRFARYNDAIPTVEDIRVVIEVSDSTLEYDRYIKLPLYAAAGITEAWLVDLTANRIERHTDPQQDGYHLVLGRGRGTILESLAISNVAISVDAILGPFPNVNEDR